MPQADYIYLGNQPVALVLPGAGLLYYHDDRLGTPQLVTDAHQGIDWIGNYQPFGSLTISASITQNLRLPGQYADAETGWSNNGFRTYAQGLGRYLQSDPIGLNGGINTYAYVGSNPLVWIDLLGLQTAGGQGQEEAEQYEPGLPYDSYQSTTSYLQEQINTGYTVNYQRVELFYNIPLVNEELGLREI